MPEPNLLYEPAEVYASLNKFIPRHRDYEKGTPGKPVLLNEDGTIYHG